MAEVEIQQQPSALVRVEPGEAAAVIVEATAPALIRVETEGPQGPMGPPAPMLDIEGLPFAPLN